MSGKKAERNRRIVALAKEGRTIRDLAAMFDLHPSRVGQIIRDGMGRKPRPPRPPVKCAVIGCGREFRRTRMYQGNYCEGHRGTARKRRPVRYGRTRRTTGHDRSDG